MSHKRVTTVAYLLGFAALLAAFRLEAAIYQPHRPIVVNLAASQCSMGNFFVKSGRRRRGFELCQTAVKIAPESADAHYGLGQAFDDLNMPFEAMAEYRESLRIKPDFPAAHIGLGISLGNQGRLEEAAAEFRAAGDRPEAQHNLRVTLEQIEAQRVGSGS